MSILYNGRIRVTTAAGVPISGGKLRIYNADTTTLTTVYSNSGLSVALTNPVVADSDGWCPTIFAAEGTVVDIAHMTAGTPGVVLWTADDHVFLGASSSTLIRDFTNSRFQVRGSGGIIYMEAGNPTGDDTGGTMTLGGWNGSQLDALTIDSAATNFTGPLTVQSKTLQGVIGTGATTLSAAATQVIALPASLTGVNAWEVFCWNLSHSADSHLKGELSFDGGATYKTSASDYTTMNLCAHDSAVASYNDSAEAYIHLTDTITVKASALGNLYMRIITPASGSGATSVNGEYTTASSTASLPAKYIFGAGASFTTATHIRLSASSGNISLSYMVRALLGFQ